MGIENSVDQMDHAFYTLVRSFQIFPIQQFKAIVLIVCKNSSFPFNQYLLKQLVINKNLGRQ